MNEFCIFTAVLLAIYSVGIFIDTGCGIKSNLNCRDEFYFKGILWENFVATGFANKCWNLLSFIPMLFLLFSFTFEASIDFAWWHWALMFIVFCFSIILKWLCVFISRIIYLIVITLWWSGKWFIKKVYLWE